MRTDRCRYVPESLAGFIVCDAAKNICVCAPCSELFVTYTIITPYSAVCL